MENLIKNPILPGFYPDPSICRAGEDYYLICSSFELCPGIPVFHSRDLANWELICNSMTPENGFEMSADFFACGVMAPTIRYNEANRTFYIINANFSHRGNNIVTAKDPAGPWSEPHFVPDVPGLDASLFFDDDGKCYVIGTGAVCSPSEGDTRGIWVQEFDIENFHVLGEPHGIWNAAQRPIVSPEGPHIFKRNGWYYLLMAEGGTEVYHAVTVARSRNLFDWFEGNPANPVLTHRNLGMEYPVTSIGHADLVELPDGRYYAVLLGCRRIGGNYKNMGRETFICPVSWEMDWPVFSPGTGKIESSYPPALPWHPFPKKPDKDDFDNTSLANEWVFWGSPYQDFWRLGNSKLYLKCLPRAIDRNMKGMAGRPNEPKTPPTDDCVSVVLRRQTSVDFDAFTHMSFSPKKNERAGFVIMQASNNHFRVEMLQENGQRYISLVEVVTTKWLHVITRNYVPDTVRTELVRIPYSGDEVVIGLKARGQNYDFFYGNDEASLQSLYSGADARPLNDNILGCMVGTCMGVFATSNGEKSSNEAAFDWFKYIALCQ